MPRFTAVAISFCLIAQVFSRPAFAGQDFATACPAPDTPPQLESHFTDVPAVYDNSMTSAELGQFKIDTVVAKTPREVFRVGGLTESLYSPSYNISFLIRTNPNNGHACLYISKVTLALNLAPTVHIAKEFKPGSCRYQDTLHHEQRHVATTFITLKEYMPALEQVAQQAMDANAVTGPFISSDVAEMQKNAADNIKRALKTELDIIDKVHFQRQQAIDTRAEYLRATRACPNEPVP